MTCGDKADCAIEICSVKECKEESESVCGESRGVGE